MTDIQIFIYTLYAAFLGACIGSFLNVVIYRLPLEKSLLSPGSHCPKCSTPIRWFDNIPLVSYIVLMGKCRKCGVDIPLRYPFVEFLTAAMFVGLFAVDIIGIFAPPVGYAVFAVHCALAAALIAVTFIDFDHKIIPNEISMGGTIVALILAIIMGDKLAPQVGFASGWAKPLSGLVTSLIGGATGAGITWLTGVFGSYAFKKEAMGFGDVKLMALIGCLLGWQAALLVFFTAPFFGLLIAVPQMLIKKDHYIAYGPFLSLAAMLYIVFKHVYDEFLATLFRF